MADENSNSGKGESLIKAELAGDRAARGRLIIRTAPWEGQVLPLRLGRNTVGRATDNTLTIEDPTLSHSHCEIVVTELSVRVRDLGSANGTLVDGEPVQEAGLQPGQVLTLGRFELDLEFEPARVAIPPPPEPPPPPPTHLPDGQPACRKHWDQPATVVCTQCGGTFCSTCVRDLRIPSGKHHRFCPDCGGACERLVVEEASRRLSLFERLRRALFGS
jgi:hypothetical protein